MHTYIHTYIQETLTLMEGGDADSFDSHYIHTYTHTYRESPTLMERPTAGGDADSSDPADTQPAEIDESMRAMLEKMMRSDPPPSAD
jgi:hypothetical protein